MEILKRKNRKMVKGKPWRKMAGKLMRAGKVLRNK